MKRKSLTLFLLTLSILLVFALFSCGSNENGSDNSSNTEESSQGNNNDTTGNNNNNANNNTDNIISLSDFKIIVETQKTRLTTKKRVQATFYEPLGKSYATNQITVIDDGNLKSAYTNYSFYENAHEEWYAPSSGNYYKLVKKTGANSDSNVKDEAYKNLLSKHSFNAAIDEVKNQYLTAFEWFDYAFSNFDSSSIKCTAETVDGITIYTIDCSKPDNHTTVTLEVANNLPIKCSMNQWNEEGVNFWTFEYENIEVSLPTFSDFPTKQQ